MVYRRVEIASLFILLWMIPRPVNGQDAPWVSETGDGQYFAVIVSDVERSSDWYKDVFGLRDVDRLVAEDDSYHIVILQNDRFFVELLELSDAADVERAMTFFKVGFEVSDIDALADRVEQRTGERPRVLTFDHQGVSIIQIRDPDGNIIQPFEVLSQRDSDR